MSFLENTRRPSGRGGRIMVSVMNLAHRPLTSWAFRFLSAPGGAGILDCGCGGGAVIRRLLRRYPGSTVKGLDYSPVSVEASRRLNAGAIAAGRCDIVQGSVDALPFGDESFDLVTAFETIYFWPEPERGLREILRVLKPGGMLLLCVECGGESGEKWAARIDGMTVYSEAELTAMLKASGFCRIETHGNKLGWLCVTARR